MKLDSIFAKIISVDTVATKILILLAFGDGGREHTPPKFNIAPEQKVVGRLLSYWEGNFSGAMLNLGGVSYIILRVVGSPNTSYYVDDVLDYRSLKWDKINQQNQPNHNPTTTQP